FPVTVDWSGSRNLAAAEMSWPAPHRFSLFGLDTFGYADEVVFPIALRPERPGEPVALTARVDYLVCQDICIPYETTLGLDLPAGPATPSEYLQLIDRFAARVPGAGTAQGLGLERVSVVDGEPARLEVVARSTSPFADPDLFVEGPPGLYFAAPKVTSGEGGRVARLSVAVTAESDAPPLVGSLLSLTLIDEAPGGVRGLERAVTPQAGPAAAALSSVLLLALLGGLILNLMPCVLPVLSLKLLGVVGHGGGPGRAVRVSFLASAAGVLFSFLVLAGALAGLKAAGVTIGWGIQFQQPLFLIAMTLLLTLFACNLWGWFEVPVPGWLGDLALLAPPAGDGPRHGLAGHFMTGALATLLATPCSAPFVGTAVGFALARGSGEIFAVFAALGLGLALPYLVVAAVPSLATWLPRPGRWMATLRRVLGLALA
ncbi:MAG: protein-disulfide reductase DsbD domain-containing protein, partial [Dongiaceae bacterium]